MDNYFIEKEMVCNTYDHFMHLKVYKVTNDKYSWRCKYKYYNSNRGTKFIRDGNFFSGINLSEEFIFKILLHWLNNMEITSVSTSYRIHKQTVKNNNKIPRINWSR